MIAILDACFRRAPVVLCLSAATAVGTACDWRSDHVVDVPGHTLRLPAARWKAMDDVFDEAVTFEDSEKGERHRFARAVTILRVPMPDDRRRGVRISSDEYLELFVAVAGTVTAQVSADKGRYWVMSRETFEAPSLPASEAGDSHRTLVGREFAEMRGRFQSEIDATRYLLLTVF